MKKILSILLSFFLFISICNLSSNAQQASKKPKLKKKIEVITKDKFILVGDLYAVKEQTDKPLVVLLHSFALNAQVWNDLALELKQKGYNVLAMDLRGHGRSIYTETLKLKSRYAFKDNDWLKLPQDVSESIKFIHSNYPKINTNNIIIVGADIGANAGALSAITLKTPPQKIVFISPMYEFKGLKMPITSPRLNKTKIFYVLAKSDRVLFDFNTQEKALIKQYPNGGPGNMLLKSNPEAVNDIINFILN